MSRLRDTRLAVVAVAVLTTLLAGCSGTTASQNVDPAARAAAVQKAQAGATRLINAATQPNAWQGPESSPRPKPGLRLAIIPTTMASTGASSPANAMAKAAQAIGWTAKISDGQGKPDVALNAIQAAVDEKVDAIVTMFVDNARVQAGIDRALAAGIPVFTLGNLKKTPNVPDVAWNVYGEGQVMAQYMVWKSGGDLKLLQMKNTDIYAAIVGQYQGSQDYLSDPANCPGCTTETLEWSLANFEDPNLGPAAQASAALQADPSLNWVSCFDACMFRVSQAADRAGLTKRGVQGAGYDCSAENVAVIQRGGLQKACFADPREWLSLAVLDNVIRVTDGQQPFDYTDKIPTALFDKDNLAKLPADKLDELVTVGWRGNYDFTAKFYQLWGVAAS
ncbi:sugar ABC transporter substrate-binding protein [Pseudonocardia yuanmonensis]